MERIRRKAWMRCIPRSKHYMCRKCGYSFLLTFNRWLLRRHRHDYKAASP